MSNATILRRFMPPALANAIIEDSTAGDATIRRFLPRVVADAVISGSDPTQIYKYLPRIVADAIVAIGA